MLRSVAATFMKLTSMRLIKKLSRRDGMHLIGITIVGGLIVSQMLTLFTTPVIYLYMDRIRWWAAQRKAGRIPSMLPKPGTAD